MPKYRILSFDGGGVRGVYTAVLLERIRQAVPMFLSDSQPLPERIDLDAVDRIDRLIELAEQVNINSTVAWVQQKFLS